MTNQPDPESDNTQPIGQPSPKNDHPDPADAPTMLPAAGGAAGHPMEEAATLPPPSASTGYSAAEDATLPRAAMGQAPLGGSSPPSIKYFGDYELLSEIARGGMGVVYKARQVNLNRLVALKMILAGQLASDEDVKRFYTEAEAAAALEHPGIVPIFEIGQHNDQHFFSMGFVDGGSLADKIKDGPLPSKEAASYTKKVAEAIAYAHSKGVIHRDLKPANILLDRNDEPKVTDFGLARRAESNSDLTRTGAVMGTPSYMPPEQAAGKTSQVGPLSDVYSLGAILYCLLTGRPPFQADSPLGTLMQVLEQEPVAPRFLNRSIPLDAEAICLKCLKKNPAHRYSTAEALARDLENLLHGYPVDARSHTKLWRVSTWTYRSPALTIAMLLTATLLIHSFFPWLSGQKPLTPSGFWQAWQKAFLPDATGRVQIISDFGSTLFRILTGLMAGLGIGGLIGILLRSARPMRAIVVPFLENLQTPVVAIVALYLVNNLVFIIFFQFFGSTYLFQALVAVLSAVGITLAIVEKEAPYTLRQRAVHTTSAIVVGLIEVLRRQFVLAAIVVIYAETVYAAFGVGFQCRMSLRVLHYEMVYTYYYCGIAIWLLVDAMLAWISHQVKLRLLYEKREFNSNPVTS